jgi:hypothetical protein
MKRVGELTLQDKCVSDVEAFPARPHGVTTRMRCAAFPRDVSCRGFRVIDSFGALGRPKKRRVASATHLFRAALIGIKP